MPASSLFKAAPDGILQRLDARSKLAALLLISITTLLLSGPLPLTLLCALTFIFAALLRRPRVLLIAWAFLGLMFLTALTCVQLLIWAAPGMAGDFTFTRLGVPFLRAAAMLNVLIPVALTMNAQKLLGTLKALHLPLAVYLPCAVMIRFIPAFINDVRQIIESMQIRGFELTAANCLRHPVTACRMAFIPLIFLNLRTAEDLGIACELKRIGHGRLTPVSVSRLQGRDYTLMAVFTLVCALCLALEAATGTLLHGVHP